MSLNPAEKPIRTQQKLFWEHISPLPIQGIIISGSFLKQAKSGTGVPARVVLQVMDENIWATSTNWLPGYFLLPSSQSKCLPGTFPLVLPSFPLQASWQQHNFRMTVSQGLCLQHICCQLVFLGAQRGFYSGLASLTGEGLRKRTAKWRWPVEETPVWGGVWGKGQLMCKRGRAEPAALKDWGGQGCCCSIWSSKNLDPIRMLVSRGMAH